MTFSVPCNEIIISIQRTSLLVESEVSSITSSGSMIDGVVVDVDRNADDPKFCSGEDRRPHGIAPYSFSVPELNFPCALVVGG
jgi:hypothetical protein